MLLCFENSPPGRKKRAAAEKSNLDDDERDSSDYGDESDLDDFINDEPDGTDVSSHIRDIFGYDRNKFVILFLDSIISLEF